MKRVNSTDLQMIYLLRHGETEWTVSKQHTGLTDIDLTENGEKKIEETPDTKFLLDIIKELNSKGSESVQKTVPNQINNANIFHKTLSNKNVLTGLIGK